MGRPRHLAALTPTRRPPPVARPARSALRRALLCLLLLASAACARPGWVETYPDIAARARRDPQSFLADAYHQWEDLEGMAGTYQVRARRGVGNRRIDVQVYALREAFVTIEALAPTGSSEGYVTSGRSEVGFWVSEEGTLYRGDIEPGAFGRALGLDLGPENIVAVLLGYAVPWTRAAPPSAVWDDGQQRIAVTSGGRATAWLHPVTARFERVVIATDSGSIEVTFEEWAIEPAPVPLRLRIEVPAEGATLQMQLARAWSANPNGLDAAFFDIEVPRGSLEAPLSLLEIGGGLLRRGFERRP